MELVIVICGLLVLVGGWLSFMMWIENREDEFQSKVKRAYLFAKTMTKKEKEDNQNRKIKSSFWSSIVNILKQDLNGRKYE